MYKIKAMNKCFFYTMNFIYNILVICYNKIVLKSDGIAQYVSDEEIFFNRDSGKSDTR